MVSPLDKRFEKDKKKIAGMDKKTVKPVAKDTNKTRRHNGLTEKASSMKKKRDC